MKIDLSQLEACRDADGLLALLAKLGWPLEGASSAAFYEEEELGGGKVRVRSLVPFTGDDPFLVLLAEFDRPVTRKDLRELLAALRRTQKLSATFGSTKGYEDTVFIAADPGYERVRFARFEERPGAAAKLRVFGWDRAALDKTRTLRHHNLPLLRLRTIDSGLPDWAQASEHWHEAFRVEALSNRFYQEYERIFNRYLDRLEVVGGTGRGTYRLTESDKKKPVATAFLQRQMNRLLFVAFLQQKEWLDFGGHRRDYLFAVYESWLADPKGEAFHQRLRKLFFGAFNEANPTARRLMEPLIGTVPYLNGGLFEPAEHETEGTSGGILMPPDALFHDLLGRGTGADDDGLLRAYDFNASESLDETDQDVAVDPEMLGRIFEQLVTDRQEGGKFYTPRPIVRFMCREALKGHLGGFEDLIDAPNREAREKVVAKMTRDELVEATEGLGEVTVLDPACGSGAYLLGMLHELYELLTVLPVSVRKLTAQTEYDLKQWIIQRSLFGVDLDATAVNIAMLRLWLALAVESRQDPLANPNADVSLPNLRFKVAVGDSLTAPNPRGQTTDKEGFLEVADRAAKLHEETFLPEGRRTRPKAELEEDLTNLEKALTHELGDPVAGQLDYRRAFPYIFAPSHDEKGTPVPGGFDIVLANPPYGEGAVDNALREKYFAGRTNQGKDLYAFFMVRALHLLRPGGWMAYIVSNTWRTLSTHRPLRKRLLESTTVSHVLDVPEWTFDATVRTCIVTLCNRPAPEGHTMIVGDLQALRRDDWTSLERNLLAVAAHGPDLQTETFARYRYPQAMLARDPNMAFFVVLPSFQRFYTGDERMLGTGTKPVATVAQGLATGDNGYYLQSRPEARGNLPPVNLGLVLTGGEIKSLTSDEKTSGVDPARYGGRYLVPYDKGGESDPTGGWLPCFNVPTDFFMDWSQSAIHRLNTATIADVKRRKGQKDRIKPDDHKKIASRFQNVGHFFRPGISFSVTGRYAPTFRYGSAGVFDVKGSTIFPKPEEVDGLLAFLNSSLARFLVKTFTNNGWDAQVDDVKRLPIRMDRADDLAILTRAIASKQKADPRYAYWTDELPKIDAIVAEVYELTEAEVRDVRLWLCRQEKARLATARGEVDAVRRDYAPHLARCEAVLARDPAEWRNHPTLSLIAGDEGQLLDFKETFGVELGRGTKVHPGAALKAIAAFMNADGGTVLVGVQDGTGVVKGLARDYSVLPSGDPHERFSQRVHGAIREFISRTDAATDAIRVEFDPLPEGEVCRIVVPAAPGVTYLRDQGSSTNEVFVRVDKDSVKKSGEHLVAWSRPRA